MCLKNDEKYEQLACVFSEWIENAEIIGFYLNSLGVLVSLVQFDFTRK